MGKQQGILYIFDLKNSQDQYAKCLEFITIVQGKSNIATKGDPLERIRSLVKEINVFGDFVPTYASNYYEQPIEIMGETIEPIASRAKKVEADNIKESFLAGDPSTLYFHIRVHFQAVESKPIEITNLQYLALLLQRLDSLSADIWEKKSNFGRSNLLKRISVFIVPSSGSFYPFAASDGSTDWDTYEIVSQYLRLLSKKYSGIIYGVVQQKETVLVRALNFRKARKFTNYFPLIPLNAQTYPKLFHEKIDSETIDELFALKRNQRFRNAADSDPYQAINNFIAETAFNQLRDVLAQYDKTTYNMILELIREELRLWNNEESVCLISLSIFLFTLRLEACDDRLNEEHIRSIIRDSLEFSNELSGGLRQIAQNTLQHSISREGVFSFYLDQGRTPAQKSENLCVFVSDYNDQQSFIENFIANLRFESKFTDNQKLKNCYLELADHQNYISLGDFFGEYGRDGPNETWRNFRTADTSAHIGLLLFSLVMYRCKGSVALLNSTKNYVTTKDYFFHNYNNESDIESKCNYDSVADKQIVPGTQLMVKIPVGAVKVLRPVGLGQLSPDCPIHEDYRSFAEYMEYEPEEVVFSEADFQHIVRDLRKQERQRTVTPISDAVSKYELIYCWEKYWTSRNEFSDKGKDVQQTVHFLDTKRMPTYHLATNDNIEIFIKGFINALDTLCNGDRTLLFAFTNASTHFLKVFRQISISLSPKRLSAGLQLFVIEESLEQSILFLGNTFGEAVKNAYTFSLEHGSQAYSFDEKERAEVLRSQIRKTTLQEKFTTNQATSRSVCPFDVILPEPKERILSLFDARMCIIAERPMDKLSSGYKLENIHMRLGSKVHIRAFYEMAFLFYRTNVANRIAFEILRRIHVSKGVDGDKAFDLQNDDVLFYGYASYSKALLTSILEILKAYRSNYFEKLLQQTENELEKEVLLRRIDEIPSHLAIASYQHNLQSEFQSEDTELFFNFYDNKIGENLGENKAQFNRPVKIVQIVPISSTLTTFDKMEMRLHKACCLEDGQSMIKLSQRYTVFWVTDALAKSEDCPREETEKKYWTHVHKKTRRIDLNPKTMNSTVPIYYFMRSPVVWDDPLGCELCYPADVLGEVPLVETDQTSTVPAQQLRGQLQTAKRHSIDFTDNGQDDNDERLIALKSYVYYGHIRREKNHFQYYIETQGYFNHVSEGVKKWLNELSKADKVDRISNQTLLNIIFSPEHATNVGFAQYVNNYYFKGNAEIVCINEDKEFRSNFKCEHTALSRVIEDLLCHATPNCEIPISFYFVDDTIISGETFYRANNFLHSLIPPQYQIRFPTNLIKKCFLLIDRLSTDSKRVYVNDVTSDFYSYLHIDLSNMRTQGDSCVCCKLKTNTEKLLKRSSTRNIAKYWANKDKDYIPKGHNRIALPNQAGNTKKAFRKLVISHIAQNVLFRENNFFEFGDIYDSILSIIAAVVAEKSHLNINIGHKALMDELRREDRLEVLGDFLKIISRPFFSYDFKVKLQVLTLLLITAEFLIDNTFTEKDLNERETLRESPYKAFLFQKDRISETFRLLRIIKEKYLRTDDAIIVFFRDCLIDNFVELRSTYMMRKATISKLYKFLNRKNKEGNVQEHAKSEEFWQIYAAGIHQVLDCNNDETKSLWLEYLLISGKEYRDFVKTHTGDPIKPQKLYKTIAAGAPINEDSAFYHFCNELFLQNNRLLFDGLENSQKKDARANLPSMEYWKRCRSLDHFYKNQADEQPSDEENALHKALPSSSEQIQTHYKVKERYDDLLAVIVDVGKRKYHFERTDIALITPFLDNDRKKKNGSPEISELDFVSCRLDSTTDSYFNKYEIKKKLVSELSTDEKESKLEKYGYVLREASDGSSLYFFVYFDNHMYPIVPVYLYFGFPKANQPEYSDYNLLLFLRDLLSYRNRLLRTLRNDFAGDIFSKYAHTAGEKSILAHEKATSHNTTGDDRTILELFVDKKAMVKYETLDSNQVNKWLLLHHYNNAQIAKLFNRSYRSTEEYDRGADYPVSTPLYLQETDQHHMRKLLLAERTMPLRDFKDLGWLTDERFSMLESVVSFEYTPLVEAKFLRNDDNGKYYNVEYFKNILIDIIISAMKYGAYDVPFLERVDKYLNEADKLRHGELLEQDVRDRLNGKCKIYCEIEEAPGEKFDYLIICNEVNKLAHNLFDWKTHNLIIQARLENPIDYADGHMSLLTISQYIEGLWPEQLHRKTKFAYTESDQQLLFESKLPVIRKDV